MRARTYSLIIVALLVFTQSALGDIGGGGPEPFQHDPGYPKGSLKLANLKTRIAFWEGPPFGGGQYQFEYSGETADFQKALDLFVKIESKKKSLVVLEGQRPSFWLNAGAQKDKDKKMIDWSFMVWVPADWKRLNAGGGRFLPPGEDGDSPETRLNVYVSKRIDWKKIRIPDSLKVDDQRLEANGLNADDGAVLRGRVLDINGKPLGIKAIVKIGKDGEAGHGETDADGNFTITKISEGSHEVVANAEGFAAKSAYYISFKRTSFNSTEIRLAKAANPKVRLLDQEGKPLSNAKIHVYEVTDRSGKHYRLVGKQDYTSDDKGELQLQNIPDGIVRIGSRTREYYYNSVLNKHDTTEDPIVIKMQKTGSVMVTVVDKNGELVTSKYVVEIREDGAPEFGGQAGSWGGSANVREDGTVIFHNVPPNRYALTGQPNPGSTKQTTEPIEVEVKGKDRYSIKMVAK